MNKLKKLIKAIFLLLKKPTLINLIIDSDYRWEQYVNKKHKKTQLSTVEIEDLIPEFNITLNSFSFLGGGSIPTDIMLLKGIAQQFEECKYFEIGTWRGESVINVAETAKTCYTLNLSSDEIIDLGLKKEYADLHGFFSKNKKNIKHLYGNSMNFNFDGLNKKFDLIFIDGNHKYEYVKNDTEKVFENLIHENSIVVWHDYAYTPEYPRAEVLAGILDGVPKHLHNNLHHVSNTMCAIFTNRNFDSNAVEFPVKPLKTFKLQANLVKL